jgi:hypothetical protein
MTKSLKQRDLRFGIEAGQDVDELLGDPENLG